MRRLLLALAVIGLLIAPTTARADTRATNCAAVAQLPYFTSGGNVVYSGWIGCDAAAHYVHVWLDAYRDGVLLISTYHSCYSVPGCSVSFPMPKANGGHWYWDVVGGYWQSRDGTIHVLANDESPHKWGNR